MAVPMTWQSIVAPAIMSTSALCASMIAPVYTAAFVQADALDETARGEGGFGSTGK